MLHTDGSRPLAAAHPGDLPSWGGGPLAWADLAAASRQYARAVPQYLTYMACAGVIAAFGVLTRNSILIVGAMAISPDLWPLRATCIGMVTGRRGLAGRAFTALIIGLAAAGARGIPDHRAVAVGRLRPDHQRPGRRRAGRPAQR